MNEDDYKRRAVQFLNRMIEGYTAGMFNEAQIIAIMSALGSVVFGSEEEFNVFLTSHDDEERRVSSESMMDKMHLYHSLSSFEETGEFPLDSDD